MTTRNDDHGRSQAIAQAESIVEMVAALNCDYDRLEELRDACAEFVADSPLRAEDAAYKWRAENPEDAAELADLQEAAGECSDSDEARERIDEDPLSVEVRSGWHSLGETLEASEFCILLCTGGPAVRIVGELSQGEPSRAWIEYQDWGTPWTHLVSAPIEQSTLLAYCQCFYFGE
jgi:hypothetical protein